MKSVQPRLLIVENDPEFLGAMSRALRKDYEVSAASTPDAARESLSLSPDAVLLDLRLDPAESSAEQGINVLKDIIGSYPSVPVLIMTAYGNIDTAVECMTLGAVDFIDKNRAELREITTRLRRALERANEARRLEAAERDLRLVEPRTIVGSGSAISRTKELIQAVSQDAEITTLIRGETGTGKELVARAIHATGARKDGPFVAVTLSTLPSQTAESELFGHEAGAFTDARERHIGFLEKAHGGTLFLDELGDLDLSLQAKLLRFLEEREFHRLSGKGPIRVDVQVIAATNADLEAMIKEQTFREDFYYRLSVSVIDVPPLRERMEDLPVLVDHFVGLLRERGKRVQTISTAALEALTQYHWPGNVRQLKNVIESAYFQAAMSRRTVIEIEDLRPDIRQTGGSEDSQRYAKRPGEPGFSVDQMLAWHELYYIDDAMRQCHGKKSDASKYLGYNDRFALKRRVDSIIGKYPDLLEQFPVIRDAFAKSRTTAKK